METLEAARKARIPLIIQLAGGRRQYMAADGAFSLELFQARLDAFRDIDLESYVADGTVRGHMLFDEPQDPSNWNGASVPYENIEAAAAYSKKLWPTLPVGVGGPPSFLEKGASWSALDFGFAQYTTKRGDIITWMKREIESAQRSKLGLVFSINVLGGNDGRAVTPQQLEEWGSILVSDPYPCGLLMWKYDNQDGGKYFQDPGIAQALASVVQIAGQRQVSAACQP